MAVTEDDRRLEVIGECLSYMCNQVIIENGVRWYNINISMENFYAGVLSIVWGCDLVNCNLFNNRNQEAFDLCDEKRHIVVQVTSTDTSEKIKHTIKIFNDKAYYDQYDELYMYIITAKTKHNSKFDPGHDVTFKIWGASDVMAEIAKQPKRVKRLYEYFKEKIPKVIALIEGEVAVHTGISKIQFDRTAMAFWMNPYAADDEKWYEDHYQIALADYLITMGKNGLYLLIDLFEKDLAYTLNSHAKELGISQQWTEEGEADTGKVLYFNGEDKACISKIMSEFGKWKDAKEPYQLLINFSVRDDMKIFRVAMGVAREICENGSPVVPEILSLVNPYKLDLKQMDSSKAKILEKPLGDSANIWAHSSYIYKLLHDNVCTFSEMLGVWIKGTDDKKYDLLEFASHSRTAAGMVLREIAPDELKRLLKDDQLLYQNVKWDEIVIHLIHRNQNSDCIDPDFLEWLIQKGSDGCKAFLRSEKPVTREDWNELICGADQDDYEQYVNKIQYLSGPERLKLLYGCIYGEKERAKIIADQQQLSNFRQIFIRKDMDTEYLFPRFTGGLKR